MEEWRLRPLGIWMSLTRFVHFLEKKEKKTKILGEKKLYRRNVRGGYDIQYFEKSTSERVSSRKF